MEEEKTSKVSWHQVSPLLDIITKLNNLPSDYGSKYSYEIESYYRKNEYIFGIKLMCDLGGNLEVKDWVSVTFNDSDDNEVELSEFQTAIDDIDGFILKVDKIKKS